mmetsp:Transcript_102242/g.329664  ORF Transcript_102242/g.329664 Transcript_102242/m.329664 type:complete len:224 (+) Transcript_102242:142-813(+)
MQATRYVADEVEKERGLREPVTLQYHNDFAEDVLLGERQRLVREALEEGKSVWHGILAHTKGCRWVLGIWALEILWLLFVIMANSMEMWGSCPFEMGLAPVCQYCFSRSFLVWSSVLVILWAFHLFLSVLLASRGFSFRFRAMSLLDSEIAGVPRSASQLFLLLSALLVAWLVVGIVLLVLSDSCLRGRTHHSVHGRSGLMFASSVASVVLLPLFLGLGRCRL